MEVATMDDGAFAIFAIVAGSLLLAGGMIQTVLAARSVRMERSAWRVAPAATGNLAGWVVLAAKDRGAVFRSGGFTCLESDDAPVADAGASRRVAIQRIDGSTVEMGVDPNSAESIGLFLGRIRGVCGLRVPVIR